MTVGKARNNAVSGESSISANFRSNETGQMIRMRRKRAKCLISASKIMGDQKVRTQLFYDIILDQRNGMF